jgi:hypothetical protein
MDDALPPATLRQVPLWLTVVLTVAAALLAAWGTQAWTRHDASASDGPRAWSVDDMPPTASGRVEQVHPPKMLYGMLPLHSGHGLRDEQCRQLATAALRDAGITDIDAGGESTLFARQGGYALFVGCHLDQKLILVGAAGPVPEQAESLHEQLLSALQTRF